MNCKRINNLLNINKQSNGIKNNHYASIYSGGKLICCGYNTEQSYYKHNKYNEMSCSMHAEINCLLKLISTKLYYISKDKLMRKRYVLYTTSSVTNSKPCNNCLNMLYKYNVNKIYYTNDNKIIKILNHFHL